MPVRERSRARASQRRGHFVLLCHPKASLRRAFSCVASSVGRQRRAVRHGHASAFALIHAWAVHL
eukprot:6173699-Pleurochrysis_carterae.AAC.1